ncbi:sulfatase-like hydrolase/transferase [Pseudomonas sp. GD03944]|uniref:sulfatase-like hydrolase/transferase n=1 Tax=Pseudomonas sp. GD03944 TaxID=2975409 RepID=UPI002447C75C|nr:sulfatase-like hydrolase/transferase [Pseudomonas sp. GD03944]MDH1261410.1 sulfatase-like hydrolase/transferase [Pseudomonas sp. GD03944]
MSPTTPSRRNHALFWLFTWVATALHLGQSFDGPASAGLALYQGVLIGSYALLFIAPLWLLTRLCIPLLPGIVTGTLQVLLASALQLLIYADGLLWTLYGFHLNGFVWNILTTPGGVEALGSSESSQLGFTLIAVGIVAGQAALRVAASLVGHYLPRLPSPRLLWVLPLFLLATVGERVSYGVSHFYGYSPLLETAQRMPFYQPLTMRRFLEYQLGLERPQRMEVQSTALEGQLAYPQAPLRIDAPAKPLNVVWLVAESWRADALNPRVMPQTSAFAERATRFDNHFSGGNGTRIGMFSQFYGLPANLWFPVLDARVGSPLIDVLQQQQYQMKLFTSAKFTYPEFDKTLFVKVPPEQMQSYDQAEPWQRDRKNIDDLLQFIDQRAADKPFMTFMFFESPHANYTFPPESVIEPDYLPDFSYASMDLERDIDGIYKRYQNAVHHLDGQIARVTRHLEAQGLLDETLIVITGDHGEEFMEKGRWGHNSAFVDEQLKVPLVLWIPGRDAHREILATSHVDLLPTLLPLLGVQNPSHDYSIGQSLFAPTANRLLIAGDWDRLAFISEQSKIVLPFSSGKFSGMQASQANDRPLLDPAAVLQRSMPLIQSELQSLRRFLAH